ncbi:DUF5672 family protein [Pectinatus frisingensis]|uniref:DUF5672 family protein n=1 Tax=Pectinatus frisingensis TaxID=865 RepID=UPI0018C7D085|nr:DUF5672 family protein [Pectinatus frisingensis]
MLYDDETIIVIPTYKEKLTKYEEYALRQALNVFKKYRIFFVMPQKLNSDVYCFHNDKRIYIEKFDDYFFTNISGYNRLMLSYDFYLRFKMYKYMLIYQLDGFVFSDRLEEFTKLGYDYIGAPWIKGQPIYKYNFRGCDILYKHFPWLNKKYTVYVGNGGVSLRNIPSTLRLLKLFTNDILNWEYNEDLFFGKMGLFCPEIFNVAPVRVAAKFSFETDLKECLEITNGKLPFAVHAWAKYDVDIMKKLFFLAGVNI